MIKDFESILKSAARIGPKKIAVAVAQDKEVLKAVDLAYKHCIIKAILVGDKNEMEAISKDANIDLTKFEIIHILDKVEATRKAVELVHNKKASILMKGYIDTSIIMKAVLDKEIGLKTDNLISHVGVLSVKNFDKLFILSDAAMNISPNLEQKVKIINNAVKVAHSLGIDMPKVALVCPVEKVNTKIQATVDAAELTRMNESGQIKGCMIGGPFALDNAVSLEAAHHKKINHPVAGNADILIPPDITAANILNKSMEYFAKAEKAGVIMGASAPIVLTSRASSEISKLNSIALSVLTTQIL